MSSKIPLSICWLIGIVSLLIDRAAKYFFFNTDTHIGGKVIFFTLYQNYNIFFNLTLPSWLTTLVMLLVIVGLVLIITSQKYRATGTLGSATLVLIGGISNLLDRLWYGFVIDYIHLPSIMIFNIADALIVIGAVGLIFSYTKPNVS